MQRVAAGGASIAVEVWSVLGEAALCEGQREITEYGGWRAYVTRGGGRGRAGR